MGMDVVVLVALVAALVAFDLAAMRWGADSRRLDPRAPAKPNL
jgi:hypothetical protein